MKRITTIICCVAFMIAGVALAISDLSVMTHQTAMAQPPPMIIRGDMLPLDLQLDLNKRQPSDEPCNVRDSVNIVDSVRYVTKVRWKTRYKDTVHTPSPESRVPKTATNPDSLSKIPIHESMLGREENPNDTTGASKVSIILIVDGRKVYKR